MSGETTRVWMDHWTLGLEVGCHLLACGVGVVPSLVVSSLIDPITRDWRVDPGLNLLRVKDRDEVASTPISLAKAPDRLIWSGDRMGRYTVISGYHWIHSRNHASQGPTLSNFADSDVWRCIWKLVIPPKIKNFMCICLRKATATMLNLFRHWCASSPLCPLYHNHVESDDHALLRCPWVHRVWVGCPLGILIDWTSNPNVGLILNGILERDFETKKDRISALSRFAFTC